MSALAAATVPRPARYCTFVFARCNSRLSRVYHSGFIRTATCPYCDSIPTMSWFNGSHGRSARNSGLSCRAAEWSAVLVPGTFLWPQAYDESLFSGPSFGGYCSAIARWHWTMELPKGPLFGGYMRKPRPASYNPAQALNLIASDRTGIPLVCPSCASAQFEREPALMPPPPRSHVTLRCETCGRVARYIAGAA